VLSERAAFSAGAGHVVLAMITSASHSDWPLDAPLPDLHAAGLTSASVERMKLFTLDERLILRKAGSLAAADRKAIAAALRKPVKPLV
jgi:mRNA interferase MazF